MAQEMPTGLDTGVLIPLCTDLTQLEGAADFTVKLVLLLLVVGGGLVRETMQDMITESNISGYDLCFVLAGLQ